MTIYVKLNGKKLDVTYGTSAHYRMTSAITALRHDRTYEGGVISCQELHMLGTLP